MYMIPPFRENNDDEKWWLFLALPKRSIVFLELLKTDLSLASSNVLVTYHTYLDYVAVAILPDNLWSTIFNPHTFVGNKQLEKVVNSLNQKINLPTVSAPLQNPITILSTSLLNRPGVSYIMIIQLPTALGR